MPVEIKRVDGASSSVGKFFILNEIPILVFIVLQTLAAIWWASGITTTQRFMIEEIKLLRGRVELLTTSIYTESRAARDFEIRDRVIQSLDTRLTRMEQRIE